MSNPTKNGIDFSFFFLFYHRYLFYGKSALFTTLTFTCLSSFSFICGTAECTPEEAFSIVGENIIFASGSPFKDVDLGMY